LDYNTVRIIKALLSLGAVIYFVRRFFRPGGGEAPARRLFPSSVAGLLLIAMVAVSVANFYHFGWFHSQHARLGWLERRAFLHLWEFYHYYLGAKYHQELGYFNLYNATIVADADAGGDGSLASVTRIRDLETYRYLSRKEVLADASRYREPFSPARWKAFQSDLKYLDGIMPPGVFPKILVDHGYNPTPFWSAVGGSIAQVVPIEKITYIAFLDVLLLAVMFAAFGAAFGLETALAALLFFSVSVFSSFSWTGGSFLRYDWLCCLGLALCLLKKEKPAWAGAFLAYAVLARVFPVFFLFGPAVGAVGATVRDRRVPRGSLRFFGAFAAAAALFLGFAGSRGLDIGSWQQFGAKIGRHSGLISGNHVGFKMVFLYDETWSDRTGFLSTYGKGSENPNEMLNRVKGEEFEGRRTVFLFSALSLVLLAALAVRSRPPPEAFFWGVVPLFMLLNISHYYYALLALGVAVWCDGGRRDRRVLYAAGLFLMQSLGHLVRLSGDFSLHTYATASLMLFAFVLLITCAELLGEVFLKARGGDPAAGHLS
jgi:hypothetical protein